MGKLYFRYGVMGSAKSATLLTQRFSFESAGFLVCVIKSSIDTRDEGVIQSRIESLSAPCYIIKKDENIKPFISECFGMKEHDRNTIKWVLVDECQFMTRQQIDELRSICNHSDINIMCYGLRTDFQTNMFEGSKRLMEVADTIEEIKFSCPFCGKKAIFNARYDKTKKEVITDGDQILIGGDETYVPMCPRCYEKYKPVRLINK